MYERTALNDEKFLDGMQQQPSGRGDGKRLFLDKTNNSAKQNMYPVLNKEEGGQELFHRRQTDDYCAKHEIEYIPPPVSKVFETKNTFVHN
jgi:hypothetical protein